MMAPAPAKNPGSGQLRNPAGADTIRSEPESAPGPQTSGAAKKSGCSATLQKSGCDKICFGSGSRANFDTDLDPGKNDSDPDPALTLIGYALGFLVHLLLKTILHHDALS